MSGQERVEHTHSITVDAPVARVFLLFTPLGETLWAQGWEPEFIAPKSGITERFMVFRTGAGAGETLWSCVDWEPAKHFVRYARVTPASRFGIVEVQASAVDRTKTNVTVTYRYVALTAEGEAELAAFTEDAFRAMIDGWQTAVSAWLARNPDAEISY